MGRIELIAGGGTASSSITTHTKISRTAMSVILGQGCGISFSERAIRQIRRTTERLNCRLPKHQGRGTSEGRGLVIIFYPALADPCCMLLLRKVRTITGRRKCKMFVYGARHSTKLRRGCLHVVRAVQPTKVVCAYGPRPSFRRRMRGVTGRAPLIVVDGGRGAAAMSTVGRSGAIMKELVTERLLSLKRASITFVAPPLAEQR